jgi:hypothetical protein
MAISTDDTDKAKSNVNVTATGITQTFTFTGAEQAFVVPTGVSQINVVAIGGKGGGGGGFGARASADIATTPGTTLYVEVGGNGLPSGVFGGGAGTATHSPGGGGGASDVRTCSKSSACSGFGTTSDPRLLVAAGGGGHGGNSTGAGGDGGGAGFAAQPGENGTGTAVCTNSIGDLGDGGGGGGGATLSAGGTGGTGGPGTVPYGDAGIAGSVDQGGTGGNGSSGDGGSGGGGFYGGGGGGSGGRSSCGRRGGGGGGGAGSSYLGPSATNGSITTDSFGTPSVTITYKVDQTITFAALANKTLGDPDFSVNATASSGLLVSFAASGDCTVADNTVQITGAGSCTITASQAGDSNYHAATSVPQSFSIAKMNQTINFGALADKTFGDPDFAVNATATSTLPVSLGATGDCTLTGNTVHITGPGSCTVTASQAGDGNYDAATSVPQSFTVAKVNQTITFAALTNKTFGDPDFSVNATASSSLPVSFDASGNCTVSGNTVHITGGGPCTLTATQAGDSTYNAATPVPQTFGIARANQTISFDPLAEKKFADPDFTVSATASSNLSVSFAASGPCSVSGVSVHLTGFGSCTITASQAGDSNYNAAPNIPQTFGIAQIINGAPDAVDDALTSVTEDSGVRAIAIASLLSNDTAGPINESSQTLTFSLMGGNGVGGTVTSDAINVYFTPTADFSGPAGFQYTVTDNGTTNGLPDLKGDTATVSFNITQVNDSPAVVNDSLSNVAENSGQRTIPFTTLTGNDSKGPANEVSQTLLVKTVGNAVGGTVSILGSNILFTPAADYNGPASFQYIVEDNGTTNGALDPKTSPAGTVSFTITEVNNAPAAVGETIANVAEDSEERTIPFSTLTANDSAGPANEGVQILILKTVSNPVGGTVSILGGNVLFRPTADYFGPAGFDYTVEDNGTTNGVAAPLSSGIATASFVITEVNDEPVAENNPLGNMEEDAPQRTIPFSALTGNDSKGPANESGQTLIVKTVSNPVGLTVSIVAGTVRFKPLPNYNGTARFQYTVEDNGTTNGVADSKTSGQALVHFNITAVADTPSVTNATTNANTQTTSGLVISRNPVDGAEVTHFKIAGVTGGSLFKNDGVTPINQGDFITVAEGNSGLKFTPGTINGSFTTQASTSAADAGLGVATATATITVNVVGAIISFSSANYNVVEGVGFRTITVERTGDTSQAVTVDYASSDHGTVADFVACTSPGAGFASSRCDFTTAMGTLRFAAGETSKTFNVLISQDNYVEGPEALDLTLSNLTNGAVFGVPQTATLEITDDATESATNPIDNARDFVKQQYHDILHREPDAPGLAFWTDNIEKCNDPARRTAAQTVAQCMDKQRESTAIAFFMSPEFQMTGGFVYRLYKGSLTGPPNYDSGSPNSSPGRSPTSLEFMRDVTQVSEGIVVNNQIDGAVLEANRSRLAAEFVARPEFVAKYGELNDTLYVQELFDTAGLSEAQFNTPGSNSMAEQKQALVDGLTERTETRASVLRKVVDGTVILNEGNVHFTTTFGQAFYEQEYRRVFVYMEYVGYLRRNPDPAGFNFWLNKLNQSNGDPFQAEMVKSFIMSPEYRSRFGQP